MAFGRSIFKQHLIISLMLSLNFIVNTLGDTKTHRVVIEQGVLSGKILKTFINKQNYYVFKGVPYAEPPVGNLRFMPPVKHKGWEGVYRAHVKKPNCMQEYSPWPKLVPGRITGSEDCLYLNIYTPSLKTNLPVLVFDHNDKFQNSVNMTDSYSPDFFIKEGIVVVFITHRLGAFGYLSTEDQSIPANAGLKDFLMGLEWIKENIKHFGGDPDHVVLMGCNGGGALVDMLLYCNKAKRLFKSAIIHSGTAMQSFYFNNQPKRSAFKLGELLNISTQDSSALLEKLQKLDAATLLTHSLEVKNDDVYKYPLHTTAFTPSLETNDEDALLPFLPENVRKAIDVPVLIGMNSREGLSFLSGLIIEPRLLEPIGQDILKLPLLRNITYNKFKTDVTQNIRRFYLKRGYLYVENLLEYAVYIGDIITNYALNHNVKKLAEMNKSPIFYYMFDFRGVLNEVTEQMSKYMRYSLEHWGATQGDELCYVFLCRKVKRYYEQLEKLRSIAEEPELKVLRKMVRMWSNFIKTG